MLLLLLLTKLLQVVLIGAKGMIKGEHRSLWHVLKTWWNTKNVSPQSLIMKNHAVAGTFLKIKVYVILCIPSFQYINPPMLMWIYFSPYVFTFSLQVST